MESRYQARLAELMKKAEDLLRNRDRAVSLASQAQEKFQLHGDVFGKIKDDVSTLVRMVKSWAKGEYQEIPWKSLALGVAALIYFINPLDVIPDFIVGTGLLDDLTVLAYVLATIKGDMSRFKEWETQRRT